MNKKQLYRFFNGKATGDEKELIRSWMEESLENNREFYQERKLYDAILLADYKKIKKKKRDRKMHQFAWIKEFMKVAAIFVIAILGTVAYFSFTENESFAMQTLSVPAGQRVNVTLPDGTIVWLNSQTSIEYPTQFSRHNRTVYMNGEAYFEVAHNKEKPFVVKTYNGQVKVLGTKFNLLAHKEENTFETSLMEGSVEVDVGDESIVIKPEQMVALKNNHLFVKTIENYNVYRWKEGLICFVDMDFKQIMKKFEQAFGVKIVIKNRKILKDKFSGKIRVSDGITNALYVMQKGLHFSIQKEENTNTIYLR